METCSATTKGSQVRAPLNNKTGPQTGPGRGPVFRHVPVSGFPAFRDFPRFPRFRAISAFFSKFRGFPVFPWKRRPSRCRRKTINIPLAILMVLMGAPLPGRHSRGNRGFSAIPRVFGKFRAFHQNSRFFVKWSTLRRGAPRNH